MAIIISVYSIAGGTLKTTTVSNLAAIYAQEKKVLIIDMDIQSNIALTFGKNPNNFDVNLFHVLTQNINYKKAIINVYKNIDLLAGNTIGFEFYAMQNKNQKKFESPVTVLKERLQGIEKDYEYIFIDTPRGLGVSQGNALVFAEKVLIPIQLEHYSVQSFLTTIQNISALTAKHNPKLQLLGAVAVLTNLRTTLHSEMLQEIRKFLHKKNIYIFNTVIPRSIRFASSVAYSQLPAVLGNPKNKFVSLYYDLAEEIGNNTKQPFIGQQ